jgi:RNA polymerase sigma factor (sigma-70 family)
VTDADPPVRLETLLVHRAWVRAVARALVADENDADDVEQQTWLLALRSPPRHGASLRGWLGVAARNVARQLGRGRSRRARHEGDLAPHRDAPPTADLVAEAELQQRIGRAVLDLDEPFREAVLLRYFEGLPPAAVADRLGVPVETVRSRLRRAHERLRGRLDEDAGGRAAWAAVLWGRTSRSHESLGVREFVRSVPVGGAAMTAAQKLAAAAVLVALATAGTWVALRPAGREAAPDETAAAPATTSDADASRPRTRRAGAATEEADPAAATAALPGDDLPPPVDLDRADRDLDLHGTVVDAAGRGVHGARIAAVTYPWRAASVLNHAAHDLEDATAATRSARDGTFALRLARGRSVALRVAADGFATLEMSSVLAGERVRVTLRPGVRLVVALTDAEGAPLDGAAVRVFASGNAEQGIDLEVRGTSGADGICAFDGLPPGLKVFVAPTHAKGYGSWTAVALPENGDIRTEIRLKPGRTLTGRVIDASTRAPIAGARIGMNWTMEMAVATAADGTYALPGWTGHGVQEVRVRAEGYASDEKVVGAAEQVDFALQPGYAAHGRIVGADGQPVDGALVTLIASQFVQNDQRTSDGYATTAADGRFRITSLTVDMHHALVVVASGHGRIRRETPYVRSATDVDLGDVVLPAPRRVEGVVVGDDGAPLTRLAVTLSGWKERQETALSYGASVGCATDDVGRFRFADVAPGSYQIVVRPPGAPELQAQVHVADRDVLDVRIARSEMRTVRFTVTDADAKPLGGALVSLMDSSNRSVRAETSAEGRAEVTLPPGTTYRWSVYAPGPTREFLQPPWEELRDDQTDVAVVLQEAGVVTGRVVDPEGAPVAKAWLEFVDATGRKTYGASDAEGRFRALVPRDARSTLVYEGRVERERMIADSGLAARVDGVVPGADLVVRCTRVAMDRRLVVLVVTPSGEPVARAAVGWHCANGTHTAGMYPTTDAAGRVLLENLPARELTLQASVDSTEFVQPLRATVVPEGQELRLVCREASRITGVVVGEDGSPLPHGSARAKRQGEFIAYAQIHADGRFTLLLPLEDTAPVRVEIERNNDDTPDAALDAVAPGTQDVRLVAPK